MSIFKLALMQLKREGKKEIKTSELLDRAITIRKFLDKIED